MKALLIAAALAVATPAVAADGYHKATSFEQAQAYCELAANSLPEPRWSGVLGATIGSAVVHAKNYERCMTLKGYAPD
jgi:hypothetical protein